MKRMVELFIYFSLIGGFSVLMAVIIFSVVELIKELKWKKVKLNRQEEKKIMEILEKSRPEDKVIRDILSKRGYTAFSDWQFTKSKKELRVR